MNTAKATPPPKTAASPSAKSANTKDALAVLKADHEEVSELIAEYEKTRSASYKRALVSEICIAWTVHSQIAEGIFYPAVQDALRDSVLVPGAVVEHAAVNALIAELKNESMQGEMDDAKVKALSKCIRQHIKEEQGELFARAKASSLDMVELGARLAARRQALLALAVRASGQGHTRQQAAG